MIFPPEEEPEDKVKAASLFLKCCTPQPFMQCQWEVGMVAGAHRGWRENGFMH